MSRPTWLFYPETCLEHDTAGHPESPQRLLRVWRELENMGLLGRLHRAETQPVSRDLVYRIHQPRYVEQLEAFCRQASQGTRIDEDTVVSTGTFGAARAAAGAAVGLAEALASDRCDTAFALIRPPGHHAMPQHVMGFCFFNNVALAALYALEKLGLQRVAILDWDAHHGNGTEHIFYRDPRVLTVSWHQDPNWPGTGRMDDLGEGPGLGSTLNIPLPARYGDAAYLRTFAELVAPALARFCPQLILVAAGYDAHHADVLTDMGMTATGYAQLTEAIMRSAQHCGAAKVGFLLEGGYHTDALAHSVAATLRTLHDQQARSYPEDLGVPPDSDTLALDSLIAQITDLQVLLRKDTSP